MQVFLFSADILMIALFYLQLWVERRQIAFEKANLATVN
jgi:hypothetical protein